MLICGVLGFKGVFFFKNVTSYFRSVRTLDRIFNRDWYMYS